MWSPKSARVLDHGSVDGTVNLRREEFVKISPVY